ncbi:MAG: ABC transporter substrate-binding protein [Oscillatoria sp. SIO1A7]|nr:ABC transporter substrate-binding protein [Oscillatoria sp. SIO1A7]
MKYNNQSNFFTKILSVCLAIISGVFVACKPVTIQSNGEVRNKGSIKLASILALEGQEEALGNGMKAGLEAALKDETVKGKKIKLVFKNDYYEPATAIQAAKEAIAERIFLAIGNVGTPTAKATLPLLAKSKIPAVGFFTGAEVLRQGKGSIVNYRASYVQEIAATMDLALRAGLTPREICAYVQNDSYGMAGLSGLKQVMERAEADPSILETYDRILNTIGDRPPRNNIGPVGVYTRNTPYVKPGYDSLKDWEEKTGDRCRLVVTAGSYSNIARFAKASRENGETWIISALSFTGADDFKLDLEEYGATDKIIMTQVVPLLDSQLPIVREAAEKLKENFGYVSLEGYIVGRMVLKILNDITGKINRENFMQQVANSRFNLGGIEIDFTRNGYQGSNLVIVSYITPSGFLILDIDTLERMIE